MQPQAVQQQCTDRSVQLQWQQLTLIANAAREFTSVCVFAAACPKTSLEGHALKQASLFAVKEQIATGRQSVEVVGLQSNLLECMPRANSLYTCLVILGKVHVDYKTPISWLLPAFGRCLLGNRVEDERSCYQPSSDN